MKKLLFFFALSTSTVFSQSINLPYSQDFEGSPFPPTGWQFFGNLSSPTWERADSIGGYGNSSACAFFDNYTTNNAGNYFGMRAPMMDLSGVVHPFVVFDVAYARRNASQSETLGLWYSTNGTTGWSKITEYSNSTLTSAPDETNYFVPAKNEWRTIVKDLVVYANFPSIRFAFEDNSDNGNVLYLDNVQFFDSSLVSIKDQEELTNELLIFPNPSAGIFNIVTNNGVLNERQLSVYNTTGQLVRINSQQATSNRIELDLSSFPNGLYYILLETESGKISRKIMIKDNR